MQPSNAFPVKFKVMKLSGSAYKACKENSLPSPEKPYDKSYIWYLRYNIFFILLFILSTNARWPAIDIAIESNVNCR